MKKERDEKKKEEVSKKKKYEEKKKKEDEKGEQEGEGSSKNVLHFYLHHRKLKRKYSVFNFNLG